MSSFRNQLLLLGAITLAVAFGFQGARGLYETTEGRYAECGREMAETDNWLIPQLDYRPHWTKPPVTYWAIAAGVELLGPTNWGVRFYNAVALVAAVAALFGIAATLWGRRTAVIAAACFATSPFLIAAGNTIHTDLLLTV
ncbi:MAG: glycosyltransferase family 39 protein, partial [Planctomycetes bacterium]|nr:glycosyltransferase family 39 protein [Planctomycetota bacterium]